MGPIRRSLLLATLLFLGPRTLGKPYSYYPQAPVIHNIARAFCRFWVQAKTLSPQRQIALFDDEIVPLFPEYYDHQFATWQSDHMNPNQLLLQQFNGFSRIEPQFEKLSYQIGGELRDALERFRVVFPSMSPRFDVYVIHSLGGIDGGRRSIDGKVYFVLGLDAIIRYHNFTNNRPFLDHELFHVYHQPFFDGAETTEQIGTVWSRLWLEGLATYVSQLLNPHSTPQELLLDIPKGLIPSCDREKNYIWRRLYRDLDSKDPDIYAQFFEMTDKKSRIPNRAGYYFGYLIAKDLARHYSIEQLVHMRPTKVRALIGRDIESKLI